MKGESIVSLKTQLEHHRHNASASKEENDRKNYQVTRNKLKKTIKTTKACHEIEPCSSYPSGLKNDCSSGYDDIPVRFIKPVSDHLISPPVQIINKSIDKKCFPNSGKIARVCPIPQVDPPTSVKDFRPISVLPVLSKV